MFGKVPPSNTPGPPTNAPSSRTCSRPSGTCLPCFSTEGGMKTASNEKSSSWKPDDGGPVVSEAPCDLLSTDIKIAPSAEITRPHRIQTGNLCLRSSSVCTKHPAEDRTSSVASKTSVNPKNPVVSSVVRKCSSNPDCPASFSTSELPKILSPAGSTRLNVETAKGRDPLKSVRHKSSLPNGEFLSAVEQSNGDRAAFKDQCGNATSTSKQEVFGRHPPVADFSIAMESSSNQENSGKTRRNQATISKGMSERDQKASLFNAFSVIGTCNETNESAVPADFITSTPGKDGKSMDMQQNCITFSKDLPTELQCLPRSYKDREKCRDPWRPTELEGNCTSFAACSGDAVQESSTKRRTGASCQALRHAVASLNRLDDFYLEKIGAGFFSEVFKVTHKVTGQVMVLKMNQLPANRPNMLKEVQLMNKLSHPNILRFMGVCVHEGQLHALTEYINGGSLEQVIMARHALLPHLVRMNLARDVARGMAYLHSRGVFHRDLTSKNVLIKKDEGKGETIAVVGDFGLAAKIPDPSSGYRLSTVGSPYWMSPECLKGQWYDHRSDVFSFGIVVCELIGRVPADPDVLPRSDNFGLDYLAVAEICAAADPPPAFLQLAFNCCTYEPKSRPTFPEIVANLDTLIANYEEEPKGGGMDKRQSVDPALLTSLDEMVREGRGPKRKTSRQRSHSADTRGCINPTPSDKARCHSTRRVAELASRRDPHYRPMTANPFHALGGVKKILGDLFSSCLELPSLEDVRSSVTDGATAKFKTARNDSIAKILDRRKPNSEPSSPTARKKWEKKVATKAGAASLFAHPLFRDGWEPRRRGSCESGFWSCVGEDLSPEPPNRRHASTLSSSAASSLFLLDDHRTSSIYTDSSEDIASLGGGDSSCWEDRLGGIGSSNKTISKIVEYFERKQSTVGNLRLGEATPSRIALLRASLEGTVPLCSISAAQRLVVCEGAVRSKLPLFDKK